LEGLEISIINLKALELKKKRLDSEFYQKKYLESNSILLSKNHLFFNDIIEILTDYHANGSYENLREHVELLNEPDYAHMVRTTDFIRDDFDSNIISITKSAYDFLNKTKLFGGEILINKIGTNTGQSFLMPEIRKPSSLGMNIFMIKLKKGYSPMVYHSYLKSRIGLNLISQKINGAAPKSIDKDSIRDILVPIFSETFQFKVEGIIKVSEKIKSDSKLIYTKAEQFLLEEIGLMKYKLSQSNLNIKNFKESFLLTGRLDAEYYQKKYEEVINHITTQKYDRLANIVNIKKSIEPGSDVYSNEGLPFIRVSDFNKFGLSEPDKKLDPSFCKENEEMLAKLKPKKETILFSKDGSVGTAYMLRADKDFITSGAILHLTVKDKKQIIPEYLTLALNSKLVQMQAERDAGGSIILHWRIGEIENVVVPIIDYKKQEKIAALVEESFSLKKQSEQLLETAKRAVEIAIEENEEEAIGFINMSK
jgi:restriction endonuclease S subunit